MGQKKIKIEFEIPKLGQLHQVLFHCEFRKHVDQSNISQQKNRQQIWIYS